MSKAAEVDERAKEELAVWLLTRDLARASGSTRSLSAIDAEPTLAAALSSTVSSVWEQRLRGVFGWTGGAEEEVDDSARALVFEAAIRVAVSAPDPFPLETLREVWHYCSSIDREPGAAIIAAAGPRTADGFLKVVATHLEQLKTRPRAVVFDERGLDHHPPPCWASRAFWSGSYDAWVHDPWLHHVLQQIALEPYVLALQTAPRSYVHGVIARSTGGRLDDALALLGCAPAAFDAHGGPAQGVVAFAALERVEAFLGDPSENDDADASDVPAAALADVARVLAERSDASWLALAWLQRLVTLGRRRNAMSTVVRMALIQAVAERTLPSADPWTWIDMEEEIWRTDRVLTQALLRVVHDKPVEAAELLAEALISSRVTITNRDPDLTPRNAEYRIVGGALAGHTDPAQWFEGVWAATYDRRERLRISRNLTFENPGHVALMWAGHGIAIAGATPDGARLWHAARKAAVECLNADYVGQHGSLFWSAAALLVIVGAGLQEHGALEAIDVATFLDDLSELSLGFCRVVGLSYAFGSPISLASAIDTPPGQRALAVARRAVDMERPSNLSDALGLKALEALRLLLSARLAPHGVVP